MGKLLLTIYILLPFVLLGLGYYLVTIPPATVLAGVKQEVLFGVGQSVIASALVSLVLLVGTWADHIVRKAEEGSPPGDIADGSIRLTERVLDIGHPRIELRWYSTLPTVNIYRLDNVVFLGNYLIHRLSRLTATLELDTNGTLAEQYLKHFD